MVNCVKHCTEVEESPGGRGSFNSSTQEVVVDPEKCRLSAVSKTKTTGTSQISNEGGPEDEQQTLFPVPWSRKLEIGHRVEREILEEGAD